MILRKKQTESREAGIGHEARKRGQKPPADASDACLPHQTPASDSSNAVYGLFGLGRRALSILRAVADAPCSAPDLSSLAPRSTVYAALSRLTNLGLVRQREGLYAPTAKGRELLAADVPRGPDVTPKNDADGDVLRRKLAAERVEQARAETEAKRAKVEALRAKTPGDWDEALKAERVRALRLRNNRVEMANQKREIELHAFEADAAEMDSASERTKVVVIFRREPDLGTAWEEWLADGPERFGGEPGNAEEVFDRLGTFLQEEGDSRYEHRVKLFNACGRLLDEMQFPSRESQEEREYRRLSERLRIEDGIAELRAQSRKRRRLCFFPPPPWRLPRRLPRWT